MIYKIWFILVSASIIQVFGEDPLLEALKKKAKKTLSDEFMTGRESALEERKELYCTKLNYINKIRIKRICTFFVMPANKKMYQTRDDFGESVTLKVLKFYIQNANSSVFFCYEETSNTYENAIKGFLSQANQTVFDIGYQAQSSKNVQIQRARASLRRIIHIMKKYSSQLKALIKSQKFLKASKFIDNVAVSIIFYDIRLKADMLKLEKSSPNIAEKIRGSLQLYENLREKARNKSQEFLKNFKKCTEDLQKGSEDFTPDNTFYSNIHLLNNN